MTLLSFSSNRFEAKKYFFALLTIQTLSAERKLL